MFFSTSFLLDFLVGGGDNYQYVTMRFIFKNLGR